MNESQTESALDGLHLHLRGGITLHYLRGGITLHYLRGGITLHSYVMALPCMLHYLRGGITLHVALPTWRHYLALRRTESALSGLNQHSTD